jgi:hypothetical protein
VVVTLTIKQACIFNYQPKKLMMKRKYLFASLLLTGIILFVAYSCTKEDDIQDPKDQSSNVLIYEDSSLMNEVSPYYYDNHIYRIELLGTNQEREQIVRAALAEGVEEEFLIIDKAQKFYFNHTGVIMYSVPTRDPEQTLILYETNGLYQVSMAHYRPVERGLMYFSLKTMDDRDYFSLKLDAQNNVGELKVFENEAVKSFNKAVYSLTFSEESQDLTVKGTSAICCRKESGWSDCMECTVGDCGSSWVCRLAGLIAPVELAAGLAASCIGAGPKSRC